MSIELLKEEFTKQKKEELTYINKTLKITKNKKLSEYEKLEIYRTLKIHNTRLYTTAKKLYQEIVKNKQATIENIDKTIINFNINKNTLSSLKQYDQYKDILNIIGINPNTLDFNLTLKDLISYSRYRGIDYNLITNNQMLIEKPIYIFSCYYDSSQECHGPLFGNPEDYIYGIYTDLKYNHTKKIPKKDIPNFEKNKLIIDSKSHVSIYEIQNIFEKELLNEKNKTIYDCFIETKKIVKKLNYTRSPEYKEKILLNKINQLYKSVKGEFINQEILYNGKFLNILKETYKLPNGKIVTKEKISKNKGKNSVIIIAITQDKKYIITFQTRIKNKIIAEFPSGYIENNETPIEAAKRELYEETNYITDDLFIIDQAYTSPGIDNSKTYIVVANNCIKNDKETLNNPSTELIAYELFTENELTYLINNNIISGAINKLAYYNLINNLNNYNYSKIHIKQKTNSLLN